MTIYDENNRPVEEQVRDADGQVVSRVVRMYNAAGLVVEEKPVVKNPSSVLDRLPADAVSQMNDAQKQTMTELLKGQAGSTTFYAYDAQGRVTTKRQTGVFQNVTVTSYNDHGDLSEERSTVISALPAGVPLSIAENGIIAPTKFAGPAANVLDDSDTRYSYQYDDYGNWTEQTASDAKRPNAPATVRRRTLTYY